LRVRVDDRAPLDAQDERFVAADVDALGHARGGGADGVERDFEERPEGAGGEQVNVAV
jgi:hypothetical protein